MGKALDIPVSFGGVSIGDATARLGIKIDRSVCNITTADDTFCGHRLSGRVVLGGGDDSPGQGKLVDDLDHVVDGVFDVKRFGANAKEISTGLTFSLADVDVRELAKFSKGSGRLIINVVAELPEDTGGDEEADDDETPDTLKAEGPWRNVPLDTMFHGALLRSLKQAGLATVGKLADYTATNQRLTDIDGIGEGKATQIEEAMMRFWEANPDADRQTEEPTAEQAEQAEEEAPEAKQVMGDWRQQPLTELGLTAGVCDMFRAHNVETIGGLIELRAGIDDSKAIWPSGIGPLKAKDVCDRLESYKFKHEPEPAGA